MPRRKFGRPALFSDRFGIKVRQPISITLSQRHHTKVRRAMHRLGLTRSDLFALLIEHYSEVVELPPGATFDEA